MRNELQDTTCWVQVSTSLIPPYQKATLLSSTPVPSIFNVPKLPGMTDPYPTHNGDIYVRASELINNTSRIMKIALQAHAGDVEVSKSLAYCAYSLGISNCSAERLQEYFPGVCKQQLAQQLHKLRWQIAIDNQVLPHNLRNKFYRKGEFQECIKAFRQFQDHKQLKDEQLRDILAHLK